MAVSHQDKCNALRAELCQSPPHLEAEFNPDLQSPHEDDLPCAEIMFDKVNEAISTTSASSAPGCSQTNYQAVKRAWRSEDGKQHIITQHLLSQLGFATGRRRLVKGGSQYLTGSPRPSAPPNTLSH